MTYMRVIVVGLFGIFGLFGVIPRGDYGRYEVKNVRLELKYKNKNTRCFFIFIKSK